MTWRVTTRQLHIFILIKFLEMLRLSRNKINIQYYKKIVCNTTRIRYKIDNANFFKPSKIQF